MGESNFESPLNDLAIIYRDPRELRPSPRNSRTHSKKQIEQIARSIERFGFNNPILLGDDGLIVAGHGRVEAAKLLIMERVPTVRLSHLTPEQIRGYMIADNRIAELAGLDPQILAMEIGELLHLDLDFDVTDLGYEVAEIDMILVNENAEDTEEETDLPESPVSPVARLGDLWSLGPHKLLCADALAPQSYQTLMGDERAAMVFTDPPYNLPINGHVSGLGKTRHAEFAMASGEMSMDEFTQFLITVMTRISEWVVNGAIVYTCMDWRHNREIQMAGFKIGAKLKNICVWVKSNAGMGSHYRSQHELIFVWKIGNGKHRNNISLGKFGRNRSNVWNYPGMSGFQRDRDRMLAWHSTVKPVAMVADAILDSSKRGDIVLDPFGGSGTTLLAAERTGRRGRLIEIEPAYVDVILLRYLELTGIEPVLVETGQSFTEVQEERCG